MGFPRWFQVTVHYGSTEAIAVTELRVRPRCGVVCQSQHYFEVIAALCDAGTVPSAFNQSFHSGCPP
jgi:hypothetical protein